MRVVISVYDILQFRISIYRDDRKSFKDFESRVEAQLYFINDFCYSIILPAPIQALVLLANTNVYQCETIFILSASYPKDSDLSSTSITDDCLISVKYESIAQFCNSVFVHLMCQPKSLICHPVAIKTTVEVTEKAEYLVIS